MKEETMTLQSVKILKLRGSAAAAAPKIGTPEPT
jgi:hypothetical protein